MLSSGDNPVSGTLAATTVAASLGSQACSSVRVQADPGNSTNVLIGNSTNQFYALKPDDNVVINCSNVSQIWAKMASATGNVNWIATT
jgi:hypothetical protein